MSLTDNYVPIKVIGNGSTDAWSGNWNPIAAAYLQVFWEDATTHVQTLKVLGTHYTLTFNTSGFTVTAISPYVPTSQNYVVISRKTSKDQTVPYKTSVGFQGGVQENSFDKLTALDQEVQDQLNRAPKFPLGTSISPPVLPIPLDGYGLVWSGTDGVLINTSVSLATLQTQAAALYAIAGNITTVAGIAANVTTVAGDTTNINLVAGSISNVNTVAADLTNINAVEADLANIDTVAGNTTHINTVAGISANVTTVAGISANVTTVAGVSTATTTVAGISANVTTVAGVSAATTTVAGISANVTTVAGISANVTTVAGDHTAVVAVAGDHAAIVAVNADLANINLVAADLTNIDACAGDLAAINAAPTQATNAAASAAAAAASAASGLYHGIVDKTFSDSPIVPLLATSGNLYRIDTSGGNVVVNLGLLATYAQNMILAFVKTTADANTITINRNGTDTISGATSITISTEYEVHVLVGETSTGKWLDTVQTTGIADGAVTLAKMANVSSSTVFYRKTAGTGAPEVQTLATLKTDLDLTGTNSGDQTISDATITTTDITTNNFTTSKHGFVPKGTNVGNFLKDDGTFAAIPAGSATGYTGSGYVVGRYYTGLGQGSWGGNTLVVTANRQYFVPAIIGKAVTLTKIGIKVATGAGTNCRLGIYNMANGVPTSLVVDAGAVTVSSTGIKEATINVALSPGAYAFCAIFDNTPTVDYYQNAGNENILDEFWGMASWGAASPIYGAYSAQSYGALPDPYAGSLTYTFSSATMPIIYVRA